MRQHVDPDDLILRVLRICAHNARNKAAGAMYRVRESSKLSVLVLTVLLTFAGSTPAAVVTFLGMDNGVGPGGAFPVSNAAAASFAAATGAFNTINFESAPVGLFGSLVVAPGVTVTLTNADPAPSPCPGGACGGISNVDQHSPTPLGFNTTVGGSKFLQVWPSFNSATGEDVTFTFATPIYAFGAYLTDTQVGFPGPITLTFNDGSS